MFDPVLADALRQVRGVPGRVSPAIWVKGAAVVLEWKAPGPAQVQALAGVRPGGIEVRVVPRPYSRADFDAASDRLTRYLAAHDVDWSLLSDCSSGQGLDLGVRGDPDDLSVTPQDLTDAAGMPVRERGGVYVSARPATARDGGSGR